EELVSTGIIYRDEVNFDEIKSKNENIDKTKKIKKHIEISKKARDKKIKKNKKILEKITSDTTNQPAPPEEVEEESSPIMSAPPTRQALGKIVGLTIVVDFSDAVATLPLSEYELFMNDLNYSNFNNNGSVKKYFLDISGGQLEYENYVFGIYRAAKTFAEYDAMDYAAGAREILSAALPWIDQQGFDFSQLTVDTSNRILAINFCYTGRPATWGEGMWYHAGTYTGFTADGVRSNRYACMSANSPLRLGTPAHENGHMVCGWPDTYKYDSATGPDGIGAFDLMCSSGSSTNPVPANPYFLWTVGWASLSEITGFSGNITDTSNDLQFFRYTNIKNPKEYYIYASLRKTGRYTSIPDEGLTIWKIDEDGDNQTTRHLVYLVHANNDITVHTRACFRADRGYVRFSDWTIPYAQWYDTTKTYMESYNISSPGTTMTYGMFTSPIWFFLNNAEGWTLTRLSGSITNSIYSLNITGTDPYMRSADRLNVNSGEVKYIRLRMKNNSAGRISRIYWITNNDSTWNLAKSVSFTVTANDTSFKEYIIDLTGNTNWAGTIRQFRLDPVDDVATGNVELDYIKFDKGVGIVPTNIYRIIMKHSGKYISEINNNIQQNGFTGLQNQNWRIDDIGDNYYRIVNTFNNKVIGVAGSQTTNEANIELQDWVNGEHQLWKIDGLEDGYYRLTVKHCGKILTVANASQDDEANISQSDWNGYDNQKVRFEDYSFIPTPSVTKTMTRTFTNTPVLSPTNTNTITNTRTSTRTITPTRTLVISSTITSTRTLILSPTITNTLDLFSTFTFTQTRTATLTSTQIITSSATATATATLTISRTMTGTISYTATNTMTLTSTQIITSSATATATATLTISRTMTGTISYTATNTMTLTSTQIITSSATATVTATMTISRTMTGTISYTATNTMTLTNTQIITSSYTITLTMTDTPIVTVTFTRTATITATASFTTTQTYTAIRTLTPTASITALNITSMTHTITFTSTPIIKKQLTINDVVIYPNPYNLINDDLKIKFTATQNFNFIKIKIFTSSFRLIKQIVIEDVYFPGENLLIINKKYLSQFSNGVYYFILYIKNMDGEEVRSRPEILIILK
ncbi:MAG: M6 family metalloprotease domain-containing protein, partial [Candidatus Goldbacteria bacterium]|nr:M6 family metalloprotease domain-containing protein [Candidatus Goldiibacteriota bacterium]